MNIFGDMILKGHPKYRRCQLFFNDTDTELCVRDFLTLSVFKGVFICWWGWFIWPHGATVAGISTKHKQTNNHGLDHSPQKRQSHMTLPTSYYLEAAPDGVPGNTKT